MSAAAAHDHGHHHKESFITKYIFSQDHKMIGKQFLVTAIVMAVVAVLLSVLFRIQLGWPGESNSALSFFLGDTWAPDGVLDRDDKCPNTKAGEKVDSVGCLLKLDAVKDGVPDADDKCPNTAQGTKVDYRGCELDSDDDGIYDVSEVDGDGLPYKYCERLYCPMKELDDIIEISVEDGKDGERFDFANGNDYSYPDIKDINIDTD